MNCLDVVYGGTALTMDSRLRVIEDAVIYVTHGKISKIESKKKYRPNSNLNAIDAKGGLILPGLINAHTHLGMTLFRGVADDLPLHSWLRKKILPLESKWVSPEFVRLSTQLAAIEMIHSGITTLNDMYYFENEIAQVIQQAGLRAILGPTLIQGGKNEPTFFEEFEGFKKQAAQFPLIEVALAPHAIYSVSEKNWKKLIRLAKETDTRIHFHLAETVEEQTLAKKRFGKTVVEYLDKLGLWSCRVIAAHAACLSENEIEILGKNKVGISHNPESNFKLGTQISPIPKLRQAGCPVALGTDSTASNNNLDIIGEAGFAAKVHAFGSGVGVLKAKDVVKMLTIEGATALGLNKKTGSLEVGKAADIIILDTANARATPLYDPYSHLIYSAAASDVTHTIVEGIPLMINNKVMTLNEEDILTQCRSIGKKIFRQANTGSQRSKTIDYFSL